MFAIHNAVNLEILLFQKIISVKIPAKKCWTVENIPVVKIAIWELVKNVQSSTLNLSHALVEVLQSNLQYFVELLLQSVIILAINNFNVVTNAKSFAIMEGVDAMKMPW